MHRPPRAPRNTLLWFLALLLGGALLIYVALPLQATTLALHMPLPTANVLPRAVAAVAVVPRGDQRPIPNDQSPTTNPQRPIPNDQSPTTNPQRPIPNDQSPTTNPQRPIVPTLTITPQMLPPVPTLPGAAPAPPTLFPTQPAVVAPPPPAFGPASPAARIPILMYHYIRTVDQASDPLGYELSVTPENFAAQMDWLGQNGYTTVRMDELTRCLSGIATCSPKAVALTLDDGYDDAYTAALPILQQHGFKATFYIISGRVGQAHYMGWGELAALRDAGMEIGAHTVSHLDLTSLDPAESDREIAQSKADLEHGLGIAIVSFCYPSGRYNATIAAQVSAAGYWTATTTRQDDDWSDIFGLPRRRISGNTALDAFAALAQE